MKQIIKVRMNRLFKISAGRIGRLARFYSGVSGKSSAAEHDIDEMLSRKPLPSLVDFNNKIKELSKKGDNIKAIESYRKMNIAGLKMSEYTISIVINCFGKLKLINQGISLISHSIKCGIALDDHVMTSVLNGFVLESRLDEGMWFFENMLKFEKLSPSIHMYNILLKGACKAKDHKRAVEIFDNMRCVPDAISYTVLISHLFKKKDFQEAVNRLNLMLCDSYVIPDSKLFGSVMKGLLDQQRIHDAKMMLMLMAQQNTHFQANVVNVVLSYYCKKGMIKHGEAVFQFLVKRNISPTIVTYNTLLMGYCLSDELQSAEKLYHLMIRGYLNVTADIVFATTMLKCYCNNVSSVGKGIEFFQKTFGEGKIISAPNVITYMTLIEGLLKAEEPNRAYDYLHEMVSFGIHVTQKLYGIVLNGLLSNGRVQWAESYFRRQENDAFNNDVAVWNIMIKGAMSNGLFGLAQAYMNEMQSRGLKPDLKTFTPLLISFYAHNLTTEAESLVKQMKIFGIPIRLACRDLQVAYRKSCLAVEKKRLWTAMKKLEKEA